MSSRDMHRKEVKKPKKDAKRPAVGEVVAPVPEVEVIRKKRKPDNSEE
jgi:hypothetical protein